MFQNRWLFNAKATVKSFMKKVASVPKQEKREKPWLA
jgi:hypothetical protein